MEVEYGHRQEPDRELYIAHIRTNVNDPTDPTGQVFVEVFNQDGVICVEVSGAEIIADVVDVYLPERAEPVKKYWTNPVSFIDIGYAETLEQINDLIAALELAGRYAEFPDLLIQHWRENGSREESETNVYEERLRNQPA